MDAIPFCASSQGGPRDSGRNLPNQDCSRNPPKKKPELWWFRRWEGETVAIIAGGPSLTGGQLGILEQATREGRIKTVAINTSFLNAPWCNLVYACDGTWWEHVPKGCKHPAWREVESQTGAEAWTQDQNAAKRRGLNWVKAEQHKGLNLKPGVINSGSNGGYQAINLMFHHGVKRILLVAYDMQHTGGKSHHHGDHPPGLSNAVGIHRWVQKFGEMAEGLSMQKIEVINCSIETALRCFPRANLEDVL